MRRAIPAVLLLLCAALLLGQFHPYPGPGVRKKAAGGCTTPTGTLLTESFGDDATSCWDTGPNSCIGTWTATAGVPAIAASLGSPPTNTACANSLRVNFSGDEISLYKTVTSTAAFNVVFSVYVDSYTIADGSQSKILTVEGSADTVTQVRLTRSGSQLQLLAAGGNDSSPINISIDTWHVVTLHLDATLANSSIQVDSGTPETFTRNNYSTTSVWVSAANLYLTGGIDYYIGNVWAQ